MGLSFFNLALDATPDGPRVVLCGCVDVPNAVLEQQVRILARVQSFRCHPLSRESRVGPLGRVLHSAVAGTGGRVGDLVFGVSLAFHAGLRILWATGTLPLGCAVSCPRRPGQSRVATAFQQSFRGGGVISRSVTPLQPASNARVVQPATRAGAQRRSRSHPVPEAMHQTRRCAHYGARDTAPQCAGCRTDPGPRQRAHSARKRARSRADRGAPIGTGGGTGDGAVPRSAPGAA